MYGIKRNGISFSIHKLDEREKPYLWIENKDHCYLVGQLRNDKSAEMLQKVIDYVCFGNGEDKVMELFEQIGEENGAV